jgi:hypothetical protein
MLTAAFSPIVDDEDQGWEESTTASLIHLSSLWFRGSRDNICGSDTGRWRDVCFLCCLLLALNPSVYSSGFSLFQPPAVNAANLEMPENTAALKRAVAQLNERLRTLKK